MFALNIFISVHVSFSRTMHITFFIYISYTQSVDSWRLIQLVRNQNVDLSCRKYKLQKFYKTFIACNKGIKPRNLMHLLGDLKWAEIWEISIFTRNIALLSKLDSENKEFSRFIKICYLLSILSNVWMFGFLYPRWLDNIHYQNEINWAKRFSWKLG